MEGGKEGGGRGGGRETYLLHVHEGGEVVQPDARHAGKVDECAVVMMMMRRKRKGWVLRRKGHIFSLSLSLSPPFVFPVLLTAQRC